jgi:hypothetical protein
MPEKQLVNHMAAGCSERRRKNRGGRGRHNNEEAVETANNLYIRIRLHTCPRKVAPTLPRNYVAPELKANLIAGDREKSLEHFMADDFERKAVVVMGEPPADWQSARDCAALVESRGLEKKLPQSAQDLTPGVIDSMKYTITVAGDGLLKAEQADETVAETFVKPTEDLRRERERRVDAGDETASIKCNRPAPPAPKPAYKGGSGKGDGRSQPY